MKEVKTESRIIKRELQADEISLLQEQISDLSMRISVLEEDRQATNDDYKSKLKPLKLELAYKVKTLRAGCEEGIVECVLDPDFSKGVMCYIGPSGDVLHERPLTPEDRQLDIIANQED